MSLVTKSDQLMEFPHVSRCSPSRMPTQKWAMKFQGPNSVVCWVVVGDYIYYPVMWGLFHKPYIRIPFLNNQDSMESKGPRFLLTVVPSRDGPIFQWKSHQKTGDSNFFFGKAPQWWWKVREMPSPEFQGNRAVGEILSILWPDSPKKNTLKS